MASRATRRSAPLTVEPVSTRQAVRANYLHALLGFVALFDHPNIKLDDGETFRDLICEALYHFDITPASISKKFAVHVSTPGRWASGKSLPHPAIRTVVSAWLRDQAKNQIAEYSDALKGVGAIRSEAGAMLLRAENGEFV